MKWTNEPPVWATEGDSIEHSVSMTTAPKSDFWRKTHAGFIADNGHLYGREVAGDFVADALFSGAYATLYDQAGLMVRVDNENWMKCGVEYVDGIQYASAVVTRDYSDWSIAALAPAPERLHLRVTRTGSTLEVSYSVDGETFVMHRQCYLPMPTTLLVGPMACSPGETGFNVEFHQFSVRQT